MKMCFSNCAAYYVEVVQETRLAILCVNRSAGLDPDKGWLPKSKIDPCSPVTEKGQKGLLVTDATADFDLCTERTFDHSDGGVCIRCGETPPSCEENLFLETGLCSWCYQVQDHA